MSDKEPTKKEVDAKLKALLRTDIDKETLEELISVTKELFISRSDTYYIQKTYAAIDSIVPPGKKYYRNIIKDKKTGKIKHIFSLTDEVIKNHFIGKKTIGIPVISVKNKTKFLLYDLDGFENWKEIYKKVKFQFEALFNITPILERSGRKDGYHIIVPTELTDAKIVLAIATIVMEKALENIPSTPDHPRPQIGNDPGEIEVFPKQTELSKTGNGQFGSMVKLPLGINTTRLKRSKYINPSTYKPYTFKGAVILLREAKESRITTKRLKHIARLQPEKIKVVVGENKTKDKQATMETESVSKPLVEDDKSEDKTFNSYLKKQHFCIQVLYSMKTKEPLPKDFKRYVARNFHLEGTPIGKIIRWFMKQPDYNKSESRDRIEKVLEELITEIYNVKLENPKDDSIDPENVEETRKTIRDDIKIGRYKSWKVSCEDKYVNGGKIEGLKTSGGDFLKKTVCNVLCQSKKNSVNSLIKRDIAKSLKSSFIPIFQQIWKIIDIEKNRSKIKGTTYVHVSQNELQTILDEHPLFCIKSTYHLIPMLIFMNLIETMNDGKRTFVSKSYSGRKYRFNKDKIDDVINPHKSTTKQ